MEDKIAELAGEDDDSFDEELGEDEEEGLFEGVKGLKEVELEESDEEDKQGSMYADLQEF